MHAAGRVEDRLTTGLEMLDIAKHRLLGLGICQQFLEPCFAFRQWKFAQILAPGEEQIEGKENKVVGLAV